MAKTKKKGHVVASVEPGSIAQELEIEAGDVVLKINEQDLEDIFDYHFMINDDYLTVLIRKENGEEWELEIEKDYHEDLGIVFENPLMDDYRSCRNKCVFCFIDQLPDGMRDTLYFKDDDSRLSFLQGNYITLTNMSDHDIDRIIRYHLEPINISFQTMNPSLRCEMLNNRFAGDVFAKIDRLCEAGIEMNGQIVLCKGLNDGEELEYSLASFEKYMPYLKSVSVVPVGLTRHRDNLYPLQPFLKEDAEIVLEQIHRWQTYYLAKYDTHLVHAGDEWYILAEQEIPEEDNYDGYLQLENGVGMVRLLLDETRAYLSELTPDDRKMAVSIATGQLAAPYLTQLTGEIKEKFENIFCNVYAVKNEFFGERITVSGLITGADLLKQLTGKELGDKLLLPCNMLRSGEQVFLDDMTVAQLSEKLQIPIQIVETSGKDLVDACILP